MNYVSGIDNIFPFIRQLPKLKELSIHQLKYPFEETVIGLSTLNEERKKLAGACKITIFLTEWVYLPTKCAPKNLYTNHDLIEIKRIEKAQRTFLSQFL